MEDKRSEGDYRSHCDYVYHQILRKNMEVLLTFVQAFFKSDAQKIERLPLVYVDEETGARIDSPGLNFIIDDTIVASINLLPRLRKGKAGVLFDEAFTVFGDTTGNATPFPTWPSVRTLNIVETGNPFPEEDSAITTVAQVWNPSLDDVLFDTRFFCLGKLNTGLYLLPHKQLSWAFFLNGDVPENGDMREMLSAIMKKYGKRKRG